MVTRRDVLLGGAMLAGAAGAYALTPRTQLKLLGRRHIEDVVPKQIGPWSFVPSDAFVLPKTKGSLADRLYSQMLTRLYEGPDSIPVMMVMAYGDLQSDLLQLHRPEVCYSAVGFEISGSKVETVDLTNAAKLPIRELTARSERRIEPIAYWTRIGDDLPTDGRQQRWMKLRQAMHGIVPDGILVRLSTVAEPSPETFAGLRAFAAQLLETMAPADRAILIGRPLAAKMG